MVAVRTNLVRQLAPTIGLEKHHGHTPREFWQSYYFPFPSFGSRVPRVKPRRLLSVFTRRGRTPVRSWPALLEASIDLGSKMVRPVSRVLPAVTWGMLPVRTRCMVFRIGSVRSSCYRCGLRFLKGDVGPEAPMPLVSAIFSSSWASKRPSARLDSPLIQESRCMSFSRRALFPFFVDPTIRIGFGCSSGQHVPPSRPI